MKSLAHKGLAFAFTLIELLVVIAIIAILVGILLPVIRSGLIKAETAKARVDMSQIVGSVKAYYGEYGKMPVVATDNDPSKPDKTYGSKSKADKQNVVMNILRGIDTANNPRNMVFLDVPKDAMSGTDKDGNSYVDTDGYFLDPWGDPYVIALDMNFDTTASMTGLDVPPAPAAALSATSTMAAVACYGNDPASAKSFITSWGMN